MRSGKIASRRRASLRSERSLPLVLDLFLASYLWSLKASRARLLKSANSMRIHATSKIRFATCIRGIPAERVSDGEAGLLPLGTAAACCEFTRSTTSNHTVCDVSRGTIYSQEGKSRGTIARVARARDPFRLPSVSLRLRSEMSRPRDPRDPRIRAGHHPRRPKGACGWKNSARPARTRVPPDTSALRKP